MMQCFYGILHNDVMETTFVIKRALNQSKSGC